mmetsp:Transcript_19216/g.35140  ORF Transcript_19216/g.35140 Transcript_19216/m.35140 type:complete len:250 (+) Transcript_19216:75-824(+)
MSFIDTSESSNLDKTPKPEVFEIDEPIKMPQMSTAVQGRKSLMMTKTSHMVFIIVGLIIHIYDCITDILYIANNEFYEGDYRTITVFVILRPLVQCLLTASWLWSTYHFNKNSPNFDLKDFYLKGAAAMTLSLMGLFDVLLLVAVIKANSKDMLHVFHSLSKAFAFVSAIAESLPQIIITMLNNYYTNTWTSFGIASIIGSSLAVIYDSINCNCPFETLAHPEEEAGASPVYHTIEGADYEDGRMFKSI